MEWTLRQLAQVMSLPKPEVQEYILLTVKASHFEDGLFFH